MVEEFVLHKTLDRGMPEDWVFDRRAPLAVPLLDVREALPLVRQRPQRLGQDLDAARRDADLRRQLISLDTGLGANSDGSRAPAAPSIIVLTPSVKVFLTMTVMVYCLVQASTALNTQSTNESRTWMDAHNGVQG